MLNLLTEPTRLVVRHLLVPRSLYLLVVILDRESMLLFLLQSLRHGYGYVMRISFQKLFASSTPQMQNGFDKHPKTRVNY